MILCLLSFQVFSGSVLNLFNNNGFIEYKPKKQEGKHVAKRLPACVSYVFHLLSQGLRFGSSLPRSLSCQFLEHIV